jgi:subtilisin
MATGPKQRYILLPSQGVRVHGSGVRAARISVPLESFLARMARSRRMAMRVRAKRGGKDGAKRRAPFTVPVRVLDSVREDGAKLVEMAPEHMLALRTAQPGLRVVPEIFYKPATAPRPMPDRTAIAARAARATTAVMLSVTSRADGKPVAGAQVVAFTDFEARQGDDGITDAYGEVELRLPAATKTIDRLYVYPPIGSWGVLKKRLRRRAKMEISVLPIDLATDDALRHFCGTTPLSVGKGVTVGIVDTGVGDHPDLVVADGENTVQGERPDNWRDNGMGHGTHVAGIVAARGRKGTGVRGLAPAVKLRSYRVFGKGKETASNFAILKAIDRAVGDGCDLINMSLGGGEPDEATSAAIADARAQGVLVVVAAGNDGRAPVSFPGADQLAIAVSAMGRKGTYPRDSTHVADEMRPYGQDRANYVACFSNVGPEIDLTGPGVAIVSTVPGGYVALDGTSMACPAATGAAAALLARNRRILKMRRGPARSDAMAQIVFATARELGFGAIYEGRGML